MRRSLLILFLFFISISSFCDLKQANIYRNSGNITHAIESYKEILVSRSDEKIKNQAILGLANCYYDLGINDKAIFYFSKYLDKVENDRVKQQLIDILISVQDYEAALVYTKELRDDVTRLRNQMQIYQTSGDNSNLAKTLVNYYDRTKDILILARLIELAPERAVRWEDSVEYKFINLIDSDQTDKAMKLLEELIQDGDSVKITKIVRFLKEEKKSLAVRPAEFLYEKEKSFFNFIRLSRLYFDTGRIPELNLLIDDYRKKVGDKVFINSALGTMLGFGMYEKFIDIIKENPQYYKDKELRTRLLDVLRSGMSFSKYFDELMFLYKKGIFKETDIQRYTRSVIRISRRWPEAFLKHDISSLVSKELKLLSLYLVGENEKAMEMFKEATPFERAYFLKETGAYSEYAEFIDEKDEFETFKKSTRFFNDEKLRSFSDLSTPLNYFLNSLQELLKRGKITLEEVNKKTGDHEKINQLKDMLQTEIAKLNISSGSQGITGQHSIILQITDLYIMYRTFNISRKKKLHPVLENLCRPVVSIACYIYFEQKNYRKIVSLYSQAAISRDELFFISAILDGMDIEPYIKGMTNWRLLDIFETSLAIKERKELEEVLRKKL